jgi:hypothetical protein
VPRHPHLFDIDHLIQARLELVREARALPHGSERNQKRQIARSLKRLTDSQMLARDQPPPSDWRDIADARDSAHRKRFRLVEQS